MHRGSTPCGRTDRAGKVWLSYLENIKNEIERKHALIGQDGITLALDAHEAAHLAFHGVASEYVGRYGPWTCGLRFESVWLVGPVPSQVFRLDKKPV